MNKLIAIVGPSGVGKTAFANALAKVHPFASAFEQHTERPFQASFKADPRYALANQIDYMLLRAEQERELRQSTRLGLVDGGLDLDFHGFTRLFRRRGLLTEPEFGLCQRLYRFIRSTQPGPELIIRLNSDEATIAGRLGSRDRINIASLEDLAIFNELLDEWLSAIPPEQILELDVTDESVEYPRSAGAVLKRISQMS